MRAKSTFFSILLIFGVMLFFMPKTNLYYALEHILEAHGVVMSEERIQEKYFSLEVSEAELFVHKIQSMHIKKTKIQLFGIYNKFLFADMTLAPTLEQFMPKEISTAQLSYALYNPLNIDATVIGDFGKATLNMNLYKKIVIVNLEASKLMKSQFSQSLKKFTRDKKGVYHYEYSL